MSQANEALNKMAENARELGLDYEPAQKPQRWAVFCQGCRKEWSVSYPHPGKDICVDCDDKPAPPEPVACQYAQDVAMPEYRCVGRCQYDTSPQPAQRTWVGLTDEEIVAVRGLNIQGGRMRPYAFARAIEAKLKEKNT